MKKAFGQTVRDLKREVNKNVLKVPKIEQKVLDATSNEPWGPHGSLLAEIAHASKSFNDYQLMMAVLWKRINDIGKNWRHVYKGLTVLEYLVAHGSERVIEDIKEHAYQISTLSDFQYIDHNGKDQGNNVRKKSQNLVLLVNDKERIIELRQKAAANKDKFRNTTSSGGMYKPGSGGYGDRFGYDDDRYEGRYGSREDDRNGYGRERDSGYKDDDRYGKFGDNSGRNGDRYGRDDDYRGRSRSLDDYNYGTRGTSSDRDKDRAYDDDANSSSRESGFRGDEQSQNARHMERKFSEQNIAAPSYEEVVNDAQSPVHNDRVVETAAASAPKTISAPAKASPHQTTTAHGPSAFPSKQGVNTFDEFDPRATASVAASTSNDAEKDRLALTIVTTYAESETYTDSGNVNTYTATSSATYQHSKDPFGDTPFKAAPSSESGFPLQSSKQHQPSMPNASEPSNLNWGAAALTNEFDILANIFAPTGPSQSASAAPVASSFMPQAPIGPAAQQNTGFLPQPGFTGPAPVSNMIPQVPAGTTAQHNANLHQQSGSNVPVAIHTASQTFGSTDSMHLMGQLAIVPQPSPEKFQTKSTVWADTLNRGLVNLNISGSKSNTLADIGIDFDALNRKEKREKPTAAPMASTAAMGKAMGSGSGIGRTGAPRPSLPNPMYGHHGMGRAPGTTMGMSGYNGINQHTGVGMGMNRGMPMSMGVGQGGQIQRPAGMPPASTISGGYNPNASGRGYAPQPYGGGYR